MVGERVKRAPPRGCRPGASPRPIACAAVAPPRRARRGPQSALPTGAPRPFEKHTLTVSNGAQRVATSTSARHARVPDARAVEVGREPERARPLGDRPRRLSGPDPAARAVVRVLDRDERRARRPVRRAAGRRCPSRPACRSRRVPRRELHAAQRRAGAALVEDRVRALADDDLVAGARLRRDGELVAHRPAGDEERGLLARDAGDLALERSDGRVVAEDVVADLGARHRLAHGRGRPRHRVAPQVNHPPARGLSTRIIKRKPQQSASGTARVSRGA